MRCKKYLGSLGNFICMNCQNMVTDWMLRSSEREEPKIMPRFLRFISRSFEKEE